MANEHLDPSGSHFSGEEQQIEKSLRPKALEDFSGQPKIVENLKVFIEAALQRGESTRPCIAAWPSWAGQNNAFAYYRSGIGSQPKDDFWSSAGKAR